MNNLPQCGHTQLHESCCYCLSLQAHWYAALQDAGFKEIEVVGIATRPLQTWSGISIQVAVPDSDEVIDILDLTIAEDSAEGLKSNFPQTHLSAPERLLFNPAFEELCDSICRHGNHRLSASQVKNVWLFFIEGKSNRVIASLLGINDTSVWRTIKALTQWMNLMDLEQEEEPELLKVVLREFQPKQDEGLLYASWRNSLWYDDEQRREGDSDRFFRNATYTIKTILENPKTKVRIACLSTNPALIVGYSVITGAMLHFVYVKADYRNKRIGSLLVPLSVEAVSPVLTKIGRSIALKKKWIKENQDGKTEGLKEPTEGFRK